MGGWLPSKTWCEGIKKVWDFDPLICPHCWAEWIIAGCINEATVIRRMFEHLGTWSEIKPKTWPPGCERP